MPYPKKVVENFKKEYGAKGRGYYYGYIKKNPAQYKKSVATARRKGDAIIEHTKTVFKSKKKGR